MQVRILLMPQKFINHEDTADKIKHGLNFKTSIRQGEQSESARG